MSQPRRVRLRESATAPALEADNAPYGDVTYADPGYQSDKKKRYPVDTKAHVKAAWSYINQEANAAKYSAANLAKVKAKIRSAAKKLDVTIASESAAEWADFAELISEQLEGSWEDITSDVRDALRAAHPGCWVYVQGTFADTIVYDCEPQTPTAGQVTTTYQRDWSIDDAGAVTLGDPSEVEVVDTVKPVGESGPGGPGSPAKPKVTAGTESDAPIAEDFIPLSERAVSADGTINVKVIAPGWGTSGYYSPALLRRDGPEVFAEGTKMYWDHPTRSEERDRPERSLRDLAAITTGPAVFNEHGAGGPGLYAPAKVLGAYREPLGELAENIGVSIRAMGQGRAGEAEGRKGRIIERIVPGGHSIDFVTTPGAGGKVLELFEAARPPEDQEDDMDKLVEAETRITALEESERKITGERDTAIERAERAEMALRIRQARDVVREALARTRLPEAVRARLVEKLSAEPPTVADGDKKGQLDRDALVEKVRTEATAELEYLAEATGSKRIRGMGTGGGNDDPADTKETDEALEREFTGAMGLSESAAKTAAAGRG